MTEERDGTGQGEGRAGGPALQAGTVGPPQGERRGRALSDQSPQPTLSSSGCHLVLVFFVDAEGNTERDVVGTRGPTSLSGLSPPGLAPRPHTQARPAPGSPACSRQSRGRQAPGQARRGAQAHSPLIASQPCACTWVCIYVHVRACACSVSMRACTRVRTPCEHAHMCTQRAVCGCAYVLCAHVCLHVSMHHAKCVGGMDTSTCVHTFAM